MRRTTALKIPAVLIVAAVAMVMITGTGRAAPAKNQGQITFKVTCATDMIENPCEVRVTAKKLDGTVFDVQFTFAKGTTSNDIATYFAAKLKRAGFDASASGGTLTINGIKELDVTAQDGRQVEIDKIETGKGVSEVAIKLKVETRSRRCSGSLEIHGSSGENDFMAEATFGDGANAEAIVDAVQAAVTAAGWTCERTAPDTIAFETLPGGISPDGIGLKVTLSDLNDTHWKLINE